MQNLTGNPLAGLKSFLDQCAMTKGKTGSPKGWQNKTCPKPEKGKMDTTMGEEGHTTDEERFGAAEKSAAKT